jgi:hypothetical protein
MPVTHTPSHERPSAMHAPAQIFVPLGQTGLHSPDMQAAVPPEGMGHGMHAIPQLIGDASLIHSLSQRCCPLAHLHMPDSQVAPIAQSIAVQQLASGMHAIWHIFVPAAHIGALDWPAIIIIAPEAAAPEAAAPEAAAPEAAAPEAAAPEAAAPEAAAPFPDVPCAADVPAVPLAPEAAPPFIDPAPPGIEPEDEGRPLTAAAPPPAVVPVLSPAVDVFWFGSPEAFGSVRFGSVCCSGGATTLGKLSQATTNTAKSETKPMRQRSDIELATSMCLPCPGTKH